MLEQLVKLLRGRNGGIGRQINESYDNLLRYHLQELTDNNNIIVVSLEKSIELPRFIYESIDQYLRKHLPQQLERIRGRATPSLVEQVEHLLDDVRKNVYPLRVQ